MQLYSPKVMRYVLNLIEAQLNLLKILQINTIRKITFHDKCAIYTTLSEIYCDT